MDSGTLKYYEENAAALTDMYTRANVSQLHDVLRRWLKPGQRVLEVGCGCGRDAAFMSELGCDVLATDASDGMLSAIPQEWRQMASYRRAEFPLRPDDALLGRRFEAVVAIATMMHVPDGDLLEFLNQVRILLADGGAFICSFSPTHLCEDDDSRLFVERDPLQLQLLLKRIGLRMVAMDSCPDSYGRQFDWVTQVFVRAQEPENEALIQLVQMLTHEKHTTTYKAAFIRALCDISLECHGYAKRNSQNDISIPLGLVVERWIHYYWPLVDSSYGLPEMRTGPFGGKLAFRDSLRRLIMACQPGGLAAFSSAYMIDSLNATQQDALREVGARIADAVVRGPVAHIGGPDRRPDQAFKHSSQAIPGPLVTRQGLINNLGSLLIPSHIWQEIGVSSYWIREASILHWARLSQSFAKSSVALEELLGLLRAEPPSPISGPHGNLAASVDEQPAQVLDTDMSAGDSVIASKHEWTMAEGHSPPAAMSSGSSLSAAGQALHAEPSVGQLPDEVPSEAVIRTARAAISIEYGNSASEAGAPLQPAALPDIDRSLTLHEILRIDAPDFKALQVLEIDDLYLTPGLVAQLDDAGARKIGQLLSLPVSILIERGHIRRERLRLVCVRLAEAAGRHHIKMMVPGDDDWNSMLVGRPPSRLRESMADIDSEAVTSDRLVTGPPDPVLPYLAPDDVGAPHVGEPQSPSSIAVDQATSDSDRPSEVQDKSSTLSTSFDNAALQETQEPHPATLAGVLRMSARDVGRLENVSLDSVDLTPGVRSSLGDAGIATIGQLAACPLPTLLNLKSMGRVRLFNACQSLAYAGELSGVTIKIPNPQLWNEFLDQALLLDFRPVQVASAIGAVGALTPTSDIAVLQLTPSAESRLREAGIDTLGTLANASIAYLERMQGIGTVRAMAILSQLQSCVTDQEWYQRLRAEREQIVASNLSQLLSLIQTLEAKYARSQVTPSCPLPKPMRIALHTLAEADCETLADLIRSVGVIDGLLKSGLIHLSNERLSAVAFATQAVLDLLEPRSLRSELECLLCDLTPRQRSIIFQRHVVGRRTTLEEIGNREGLTRERVRQLQKKAEEHVRLRIPTCPLFSSALALAILERMDSPMSVAAWADVLRRESLLTDDQEARTLLDFAQSFAVSPLAISEETLRALDAGVSLNALAAKPAIISKAKATCRQSGVVRIESLRLNDVTTEEIQHLLMTRGYRLLEAGWWYLPGTASVLLRTATKMICFCGPLHPSEIRYGARKALSRKGFPTPPSDIIRSLLLENSLFNAEGEAIALASAEDTRMYPSGPERIFLSVAKSDGPVVTFEMINERIHTEGFSAATTSALLKYSPLVRKVGRAMYTRVAAVYDSIDLTRARTSARRQPPNYALIPRTDGLLELRVNLAPWNLLHGIVGAGPAESIVQGEWQLVGGKEPKTLSIRKCFITGLRDEMDRLDIASNDRIALEFDTRSRKASIRKVGLSE